MIKHFAKLKLKDFVSLVCLILVGFGWLLIDQAFLAETSQRFAAFLILIFLLLYLQFVINKPHKIMNYANTLALVLVSFAVAVSLIMHVVISNDFTYKSILIWIISAIVPYIAGVLYLVVRPRK